MYFGIRIAPGTIVVRVMSVTVEETSVKIENDAIGQFFVYYEVLRINVEKQLVLLQQLHSPKLSQWMLPFKKVNCASIEPVWYELATCNRVVTKTMSAWGGLDDEIIIPTRYT